MNIFTLYPGEERSFLHFRQKERKEFESEEWKGFSSHTEGRNNSWKEAAEAERMASSSSLSLHVK